MMTDKERGDYWQSKALTAEAENGRLKAQIEAAKAEHLAVRRIVATVTPHYHDEDFDLTRDHLNVLAAARDAMDAALAKEEGK